MSAPSPFPQTLPLPTVANTVTEAAEPTPEPPQERPTHIYRCDRPRDNRERCGGHLDMSQPDQDRPFRLLGICAKCGAWNPLDFEPETAGQPANQAVILTAWWTSDGRVY